MRFATKGMNYARLDGDLARAASVIPYNRRDGLLANLGGDVATMAGDIGAGQPGSVIAALRQAEADLHDFVVQEVASGQVVMR